MFVPSKPSQHSIMFSGEASAYLKFLTLPSNIKLGWKSMLETNTLAYLGHMQVKKKKFHDIICSCQCYKTFFPSPTMWTNKLGCLFLASLSSIGKLLLSSGNVRLAIKKWKRQRLQLTRWGENSSTDISLTFQLIDHDYWSTGLTGDNWSTTTGRRQLVDDNWSTDNSSTG